MEVGGGAGHGREGCSVASGWWKVSVRMGTWEGILFFFSEWCLRGGDAGVGIRHWERREM